MTKFSVLLSIYKKENPLFFKQSMDSLFTQTILPSEIVLIKDGPLTPELDTIISKYQSKHSTLKVISLPINQGLGNALNEGLKHCSYDLIARMDTDDIAKPSRFEKQIRIFQENPQIDICSAWIEEFEETPNNILAIRKLPETHEEIIKYAKHRCPINHPVVMYKKNAVIKAGGYKGFPEDYRLWINMIMTGAQFHNIQESLLYFRFSKEMVKRRGGWRYAIADAKSQWDFYKIGFLDFPTFLYNFLVRMSVRLTPNNIREIIYKKLLRK